MSWEDEYINYHCNNTPFNNMRDFLIGIRAIRNDTYYDFIKDNVHDKSVLDVGVVCHEINNIEKLLHHFIVNNSSHTLGVDILSEEIKKLDAAGYNVTTCDAKSDEFLGELFDVVFMGDIIEHVNNPILLMEFGKRHLKKDGIIIVSTPNPFHFPFVIQNMIQGTFVANPDHISWITPQLAAEIGRRAGLSLSEYVMFNRKSSLFKFYLKKLIPIETLNGKFNYVFKNNNL